MEQIYVFTFHNGKLFVGQTTNLKRRYITHKSKRNNHRTLVVDKAIKKYRWDNVQKIEMSCSEEYLDWMEQEWIKELDCVAPKGYNLDSGGNLNRHLSELTKNKIGRWSKENHKVSDAGRERIRASKLGTHLSKETLKKISGPRPNVISWNKGLSTPKNIRQKQSLSKMGSKNANFGKPRDLETIEKIRRSNIETAKKNPRQPLSSKEKRHLSELNSGSNNAAWKGGVSSKYKRRRRKINS